MGNDDGCRNHHRRRRRRPRRQTRWPSGRDGPEHCYRLIQLHGPNLISYNNGIMQMSAVQG